MPETNPFSEAQVTAPVYQVSATTSANTDVLLSTSALSKAANTVTNIARVIVSSGEKVVSLVPAK